MLRFPQQVFFQPHPSQFPAGPAPMPMPMPAANPYVNAGSHMQQFAMQRQAYANNAFGQPPILQAPPMPAQAQRRRHVAFAPQHTMHPPMPQQAAVTQHPVQHHRTVVPAPSQLRSIQRNARYEHLSVGQPTLSRSGARTFPILEANGMPGRSVMVIDTAQSHQAMEQSINNLAALEERGFPVLPVHSIGTYQGHPARIVANMVDVDMNSNILSSPYASARTLKNLEYIRHQLDAQNITIHGLGLCMNPESGAVYIREARAMSAGRPWQPMA